MNSKALYKISYGMYLVGAILDGKANFQVANTVFQVTSEPQTIAISINKKNFTHGLIEKSKKFSVMVLKKDTPVDFIQKMGFTSGRNIDKLAGTDYTVLDGVPILKEHAAAFLIADVTNEMDAGTHTIFLGKVKDAEVLDESEVMGYAYYRQMKSGATPMTAPTYNPIKDILEKREENKTTVKIAEESNGGTAKMEINQVYKCAICGNIVQVNHVGGGTLVCCGEPMALLKENTTEASQEKHVPVIEKTSTGFKIKVGSVAHPMEEKHYIQWIEIIADGISYKKFLKPGDKPETEFQLKAAKVIAREYCNLHGFWKA